MGQYVDYDIGMRYNFIVGMTCRTTIQKRNHCLVKLHRIVCDEQQAYLYFLALIKIQKMKCKVNEVYHVSSFARNTKEK